MSTSTPTRTTRIVELADGLTVAVDERGNTAKPGGSAVLLLHGGAGPFSVAALAGALAERAYVITPTHPGFDGRPRPDWVDSVADLASAYLDLLDILDVREVLVIGNSVGGWIASEMALRDNHKRIGGLVLLNAVGIRPDSPHRIASIAEAGPAEFLRLAWHNPALRPDPAAMDADRQAAMAANQQTMAVYADDPYMHDPKLGRRLHRVTVPVLVAWGEHDGVVPAAYGRAYAGTFPDARFQLIPDAAHFPQIEQLGLTVEAVGEFVRGGFA
ncbi:MAG: alpha/beta fold hydrolase [Kibdelosporangium sp.]